ncbi:glycosyltransferase involved in cell wall biosynthesis [Elusimicrobium simillimum]|uniref:glycosyltransferase n=1 Tax=Elusimicrobium simillimum TaxID=3143438 RepID=UPI003C6F3B92
MKILFVITSTDMGGAEKAAGELALSMSKEHTVKVITLYPAGFYAKKLHENGVKVASLNMGYWPKITDLIKLKNEIAAFKPDVVHAMLYRAIQMCRMLKQDFKLFTTPHANYMKKSKFLRIVDAALKSKDNLSLAESHSTAEFLLTFQRYNKDKVKIILNTPAPDFVPDDLLRKMARAANNAEDKIVFINVARLHPHKAQATLLNAFAKLYAKNQNTALWLVGEGAEKQALQNLAATLQIDKAITFFGAREDVPALLNAADIFVLPSLEESLPLALLEAAACGKPLITSDVGDNTVVCRHGKNGFVVNQHDPVLFSAVMGELADNAQLRESFGQESLKAAQELKTDYLAEHLQIYL